MNFHSYYILLFYTLWAYVNCSGELTTAKLLGCYEDQAYHRLFDNFHLNSGAVTACDELCLVKGYQYAGIENGNSCYCGNQFPSRNVKISNESCSSVNFSVTAVSAYQTKIFNDHYNRPRSKFLGCYKDSKVYADEKENSLLKGYWKEFKHLAPVLCDEVCYQKGFLYFGLTYGTICHCGDQQPPRTGLLSNEKCYIPCPGDSQKQCGGSWELSIYSTGISDLRSIGKASNCLKIKGKKYSIKLRQNFTLTNSPRRCINICSQYEINYIAVINETECACIQLFDEAKTDGKEECEGSFNCSDDFDKICDNKHVKLFQILKLNDMNLKAKYLGCYVDSYKHRVLSGNFISFQSTQLPISCVVICFNRGYPFAGLENGKTCSCGNEFPSTKTRTLQEECDNNICIRNGNETCDNFLRTVVYETGISKINARPRSTYVGCFKDSKFHYEQRDNSILKGYWRKYEHLKPVLCDEICYSKGFLYFGLSDGNLCYCGDQQPHHDKILTDDKCYQPCSAEPHQRCGGSWEFNIYATGISDTALNGNNFKCVNTTSILINTEKRKHLEFTNSPKRCSDICGQLQYNYAGVTNKTECYCMNNNSLSSLNIVACDVLTCPGDVTSKCGDEETIKIYSLGMNTALDTATEKCEMSQTIVKGKNVCTGVDIFKEDFSSSQLDSWAHVIQIATWPDFEFVTYGSSPKNIYIRDGKLFIKPTLRDEKEVVDGSLSLKDCTGKYGTAECQKTAISFSILPPIESGKITTKNIFSFRYGTISIRAKVPFGDWIIPDISLVFLGENNSALNRIKLASVRGNERLQCGDEELGSSLLESGLYISDTRTTWKNTFTKRYNTSWSAAFHTYTTIWAPDSIIFSIDNELVDAIDRNQPDLRNFDSVWNPERNNEVYISIGVSVGGVTGFPDNCYSNGKLKPWTNDAAKAILRFWTDRSTWQQTWHDEKAALQVEEIVVQSL